MLLLCSSIWHAIVTWQPWLVLHSITGCMCVVAHDTSTAFTKCAYGTLLPAFCTASVIMSLVRTRYCPCGMNQCCFKRKCDLQAAHLDAYLADIGIIFALDWLLDRCRSIPNVLGDCFTCAIVQHKCGATDQIITESVQTGLIGSLLADSL